MDFKRHVATVETFEHPVFSESHFSPKPLSPNKILWGFAASTLEDCPTSPLEICYSKDVSLHFQALICIQCKSNRICCFMKTNNCVSFFSFLQMPLLRHCFRQHSFLLCRYLQFPESLQVQPSDCFLTWPHLASDTRGCLVQNGLLPFHLHSQAVCSPD